MKDISVHSILIDKSCLLNMYKVLPAKNFGIHRIEVENIDSLEFLTHPAANFAFGVSCIIH